MKKLDDYLYYEEKDPDLKIYCGDLMASWYNIPITRRWLWDREKATSSQKNMLQSGCVMEKNIIVGWAIQLLKRVVGQEHCDCLKTLARVPFVAIQNLKGITLTETPPIMIRQTLKSLVGSATWLLINVSQILSKWLKKQKASTDGWLLWKKSVKKLIVLEGMNTLALIKRGLGYAAFA